MLRVVTFLFPLISQSKMTLETKTAVNTLASKPMIRVTAKPFTLVVPKMKRKAKSHDGK